MPTTQAIPAAPAPVTPELLIVEAVGWSWNNESEWCYGPDSEVGQSYGEDPIVHLCEQYEIDAAPSEEGAVVECVDAEDENGRDIKVWQIYDVAAWVRAAKDLRGLAYRLRCCGEAGVTTPCELPTYGGEQPADTQGIYSWDADDLLVPDAVIQGGRATWGCVPRRDAR